MPMSSAPAGQRTVPRGWLLAGLVMLSYFCTSLVVVLHALGNATGVVWLPSFPTGYYRFGRWLSWPFQGYFTLRAPLRAHPQVRYMTYALIAYTPFLIGAATVTGVAALKWSRSSVAS
jgi:hypothetical protein